MTEPVVEEVSSEPTVFNKLERKNIHQRLAAVKESTDYIQREQSKVNGQYRPVSANAIIALCRPVLQQHGVNFVSSVVSHEVITVPGDKDGKNEIKGYLSTVYMQFHVCCTDVPEDGFSFNMVASGFDSLDKGFGKAVTYAQKVALVKLLMIEVGDGEESGYDFGDPPNPAQLAKLDTIQINTLRALGKAISVADAMIVGAAAVPGVTVLEHIPAAKYDELYARLKKRHDELVAGGHIQKVL